MPPPFEPQDRFDERAGQYSAGRVGLFNEANRSRPRARSTERDLLIRRLDLKPGLRICDAVAGGGYIAEGIHDQLKGQCEIICVENSESFAETIDPRFHPLVSSLCAIDLPDESVDRVACLAGLHHQENKAAFFDEAYRILRPGGIVAAADAAEDSAPARFLNGPVDHYTELGHDGLFLQPGDFTEMLLASGFTDVGERQESYHWLFHSRDEMVSYCHTLFRMGKASFDEVARAIDEYLEVEPVGGDIGMVWGLIYAVGRKPSA